MSNLSNNKLDVIRRLLLGSLYDSCKDRQGVTEDQLNSQFQKLKSDGCIGNCDFEGFKNMCDFKVREVPRCYMDDEKEERECIENKWKERKGVDKFFYDKYKTSLMFENEPDTDEEESDDEHEGEECVICMEYYYEDTKEGPMKLSCSHMVHRECLKDYIKQSGKV